jgi:peptidoglycan hydrolase-like protein with peptidoglycan-binding domain
LERGSGYQSAGGSHAVRIVQRRLLRLGLEPGPIDGLYGPLTQGAVERFQQRRGLAVDGIVGRQTRRTLFSKTNRSTASRVERDTRPGRLTRKSPAPNIGSESASEHPHARPLPADAASRNGPVSGTSGVPPEAIAALAALAALLLFLTLRRQGEVRLNLGLTCAALLGVFGVGAVAGAVFATRAAPHGTDRATAQSGLLPAGGSTARSAHRRTSDVRWARPRRVEVPAHVAAGPSPQISFASPITPVAPVAPVAVPAPSAPPPRSAKPRVRVQARFGGGAKSATDSSLGGGVPAGGVLKTSADEGVP